MFEIRLASAEDKESILLIYISAVTPVVETDETYWDHLIRAGGLLVAQTEGRIIGFGGIDVNAREQLKWLYLLPQYQRAGIGSEILTRLEFIGWEAGLRSLRLHSAPGAVEFYRRHGYRAVEATEQIGHDHEVSAGEARRKVRKLTRVGKVQRQERVA